MISSSVTVDDTDCCSTRDYKREISTSKSLPEDLRLTFITCDAMDIWLAVSHKGYRLYTLLGHQLRTLEIDVKGGSSYDSRVPAAPTHSAFISAASTNSKWSTAVPKSDPQQQITYEDFDHIGKLDLEELDIQNGSAAYAFWKKVDSKTSEDMEKGASETSVSVLVLVFVVRCYGNGSVGASVVTDVGADWVSVAVEFDDLEVQYKEYFLQVQAYKSSLQNLEQQQSWYQNIWLALEEKIRILTADLGNTTNMLNYTEKLNEQAKLDNMNTKVKLEESNARFDKWKESSKNLVKLINSSMKPLSDWFVKPVGMHAVPPPITGTFMPPSNKPDIDDTPVYDKSSDSEPTDFASCVPSVQTSSSTTTESLASASSSVDLKTLHKTDDLGPSNVTQSPSFSFKENVKAPRNLCNRNGSNNISLCKNKSFGFKKCFVCGSKFHLIRDCDFYENQLRLNNAPVWKNVENIPSFVPRPAYVPAGSRNRPASVPAGSRNRPASVPAGSRNRPASVPAGRPFPAGWHNPTAQPMTRPKSHYFQQFSRSGSYNQMVMEVVEGWDTVVKTLQFVLGKSKRHILHWGSKKQWWISQIYRVFLHIDHNGRPMQSLKTTDSIQVVIRVQGDTIYCFNLATSSRKVESSVFVGKSILDDVTKWIERVRAHKDLQVINAVCTISEPFQILIWIFMVLLPSGDENFLSLRDFHSLLFENQLTLKGGIKRDYSVARTPQQNGVAERKNRNLHSEDSKNYVSDYKLYLTPKCFGQKQLTILNTSDHFGKIEGKADGWFSCWVLHDTKQYAGTYDDSDIEMSDEQLMLFLFFLLNRFYGLVVNPVLTQWESTSGLEEELARLQRQEFEANSAAKDTWNTADTVPADVYSTPYSSSMVEPVHVLDHHFLLVHFIGSSENSTRFPSPSDLANHISSSSEMEGIHHHPTTGIFSESSYDAEFGGSITNLAPHIDVDKESLQEEMKQLGIQEGYGSMVCPYQKEKLAIGLNRFVNFDQDKYVQDMLKKFDYGDVRSATYHPLKLHLKSMENWLRLLMFILYRSMIGFPRCIGQLHGGYSVLHDSDMAGSHGDRKSTTGGWSDFGLRRLISWQCTKQTIVLLFNEASMLLLPTAVMVRDMIPDVCDKSWSVWRLFDENIHLYLDKCYLVLQEFLMGAHVSIPDPVTFYNVEHDVSVGFHRYLTPRSTKAHLQEVVGKLIKKVKELEDKLTARKKKFVVTESDIEEEEEQDVDPLIKLAKAAATAADDSAVPAGDSKKDDVSPSSTIPSDAFAGGSFIPPGDTTGSTAAPSDKGKSPLLVEEHPVRKRSFRQRKRTGWAKRPANETLCKKRGCIGTRDRRI
ncbi:putative ribonuclease H-like domain-containing protein [Tanacetum coccineum]